MAVAFDDFCSILSYMSQTGAENCGRIAAAQLMGGLSIVEAAWVQLILAAQFNTEYLAGNGAGRRLSP